MLHTFKLKQGILPDGAEELMNEIAELAENGAVTRMDQSIDEHDQSQTFADSGTYFV